MVDVHYKLSCSHKEISFWWARITNETGRYATLNVAKLLPLGNGTVTIKELFKTPAKRYYNSKT